MKLIPKKFGKTKYIKGVEEVIKKKPAPVEQVKEKPKKQKIVMMPCMSAHKKERDTKGQFNTSEKKVKPKALTVKKNQKYKDVGTQIRYQGDGRNLSLMELDILRTTGCKWSKIIYPGFKGLARPY